MFVQQTPNSQLLQQLRQTESKIMAVTGDRVKLVERSGTKLRHMLVSSDPWRNTKCSDKKCLVCTNPLNTNFLCRKRNVSYKNEIILFVVFYSYSIFVYIALMKKKLTVHV